MVGPFGEVLVMDWGVAKRLGDAPAAPPEPAPEAAAPNATAHGTIVGTPAYMAPEQARGDVDRVDVRSDVYALGAILYFMLTGRAPGRSPASPDAPTRTWAAPRHAAVAPGIVPPRDLAPDLPRPLEAICLKALALEPERRYGGASELASDVGRFLEGERVAAYPEGLLGRALRFATRYRTPLLVLLAYVVMRLVLLLVARV
jgi:serine/threonine protein kinase